MAILSVPFDLTPSYDADSIYDRVTHSAGADPGNRSKNCNGSKRPKTRPMSPIFHRLVSAKDRALIWMNAWTDCRS